MKPTRCALAVALITVLCSWLVAAPAAADHGGGARSVIVVLDSQANLSSFAPLAGLRGSAPEGDYLDAGVVGAAYFLGLQNGFIPEHVYSASLRGFSANLNSSQVAAIKRLPFVSYVVDDDPVEAAHHSSTQIVPWGIYRVHADESSTHAGDGTGTVDDVKIYVIDTGIDTNHPDLNVVDHVSFVGSFNGDCNGHGTHVAGTAAAKDNSFGVVGVAPGAELVGVRVLRCTGWGQWSAVLAGIDWVTAHADGPSVATLALVGPSNQAVDQALEASARSVFYAVAAGNDAEDACDTSPAAVGENTNNGVMTTAAIGLNDDETAWSNYGDCVDVWAPGEFVLSTWLFGTYWFQSGTSMAAAHTAGAAALYLSNNPEATPVEVEQMVRASSYPPGIESLSKDGRDPNVVDSGGF